MKERTPQETPIRISMQEQAQIDSVNFKLQTLRRQQDNEIKAIQIKYAKQLFDLETNLDNITTALAEKYGWAKAPFFIENRQFKEVTLMELQRLQQTKGLRVGNEGEPETGAKK